MQRVLVFGNSGSGKSTYAKRLKDTNGLAHLDLDSLAWQKESPTQRAPISVSQSEIKSFIQANPRWVIEGCYTDLLSLLVEEATEIVFMNLDVILCKENARQRPWEPHKYPSPADQDKNLSMLLEWIEQYHERDDEFSFQAHKNFYERFIGKKTIYHENPLFE
ncbi:shikimate kinase [Litoribacillus peritrichatus]|uniref:Shikimate kinase n=1 Tax=Litoribacillus peritrichatus TaxID=718191 RepID=A0ABP7M823_9GAMM